MRVIITESRATYALLKRCFPDLLSFGRSLDFNKHVILVEENKLYIGSIDHNYGENKLLYDSKFDNCFKPHGAWDYENATTLDIAGLEKKVYANQQLKEHILNREARVSEDAIERTSKLRYIQVYSMFRQAQLSFIHTGDKTKVFTCDDMNKALKDLGISSELKWHINYLTKGIVFDEGFSKVKTMEDVNF